MREVEGKDEKNAQHAGWGGKRRVNEGEEGGKEGGREEGRRRTGEKGGKERPRRRRMWVEWRKVEEIERERVFPRALGEEEEGREGGGIS